MILTGDFNAKLEVKNNLNDIIQQQSRNGKILQQMIEITKTTPISIKNENPRWTRVNRNNPREKSIIDYILVSEEAERRTMEIYVDEDGLMKIQGKHQSDHNPIMITLDYSTKKGEEKITRWNTKNNDKWPMYNKIIQKTDNNNSINDYTKLENAIQHALIQSIGKTTFTKRGKPAIPEDIKPLIKHKKEMKRIFISECKNNGPNKGKYLDQLKQIITTINQKMNEHRTKRIEDITSQIIKEGGVNSRRFWNMRKQILNQGTNNSHPVLDEDSNLLDNPTQAKEHIANFYENLYKAREPREEYPSHSNVIISENTRYTTELAKAPKPEPISMKELNLAIKKLKARKATGPDEIPNEAMIYADRNTRKIILRVFNEILNTLAIPTAWQKNQITRFYKGKGT